MKHVTTRHVTLSKVCTWNIQKKSAPSSLVLLHHTHTNTSKTRCKRDIHYVKHYQKALLSSNALCALVCELSLTVAQMSEWSLFACITWNRTNKGSRHHDRIMPTPLHIPDTILQFSCPILSMGWTNKRVAHRAYLVVVQIFPRIASLSRLRYLSTYP